MKHRYLSLGLGLVLSLSLVACGGQQAPEPQQSGSVQQTEPATEPQGQPVEIKQEDNQAVPVMAPVDTDPSMEDGNSSSEGDSGEVEPAVEVQLFDDVNETVYATGTVNIRASWSTDSKKLGSLSVSDSVVRTGISVEGTEAQGWSRVQLADGSTAYIGNKYLSTTKPVVQTQASTSSKPNGQGQQQQPQPVQQQPSGGDNQQNQQSSGPITATGIGLDGDTDLSQYVGQSVSGSSSQSQSDNEWADSDSGRPDLTPEEAKEDAQYFQDLVNGKVQYNP